MVKTESQKPPSLRSIDAVLKRSCNTMNKFSKGLVRVGLLAAFLLAFEGESLGNESPGEKISELIGEQMVQVLKSPDRVEFFDLNPMSAGQNDGLSGYSIIKKNGELNRGLSNQLSALALDDKSHVFEIQKKCRFRPNIGFRFYREGTGVNVLLSLSCKQWAFDSGVKQVYEDFDPVFDAVKNLVLQARAKSN